MDSNSFIIVCNDFNEEIQLQSNGIEDMFLRILQKEEEDFKIENAHEVIKEAYIASSQLKTIIMAANYFNHFAQNALLKIIEEPPFNIRLILMVKNKSSLLPTIRSRLPIIDKRIKIQRKEFDLNLKNLSLQAIYDFLKSQDGKSELSVEDIKSELGNALVEEQLSAADETEESEADTNFSLNININDNSVGNSAWDLVKRHKANK